MKLVTLKATIDLAGQLILEEPFDLKGKSVLITILPEVGDGKEAEDTVSLARASALLSEPVLATFWDRPEEDEAWEHLKSL
ncbi:MAG: hypothetical protein SH809_09580 [Rhodothermales bacterium]|nr:hypothetical protein [Rhodothermales bacterium]